MRRPFKNLRPRCEGQTLLCTIVNVLQRVVSVALQSASSKGARKAPIKKLRKYDATKFKVVRGTNTKTVEYWLKAVGRVFDQLECMPFEQVICVISFLKEESYQWWLTITQHILTKRVT